MDFKVAKYFLTLSSSLFFSFTLYAAPPQDLSVFDKPMTSEEIEESVGPKRRLRFKEDDVTAGEPPAGKPTFYQIKFDVSCRDKPGRQGKPKGKLKKGAKVKLVKVGAQWMLVSPAPKKDNCWIPNTSVN